MGAKIFRCVAHVVVVGVFIRSPTFTRSVRDLSIFMIIHPSFALKWKEYAFPF